MPPADSFEIRPARASDRASVIALIPRLRAFGPPPLRPPEAMDGAEQRTIHQFFDEPPGGARLWIAEGQDGALVGAAYAERAVDYFTREPHGHLGILVVAAEAEGRGVGRALLAAVESWAAERRDRFLTLNVFATNARATAVYERAGYRPDTVRYVKELRPPHPSLPTLLSFAMPAYVIVQIDVTDPATYERYKALTPASLLPFDGRFLVRGGQTQTLEGSWAPTRLVVVEFPSADHARRWWASPEYAPAKAIRQASANTEMLLVEGFTPPSG